MAAALRSLAAAAALLAPAGASLLRRAADPCDCVNWQEAYRTGGAKCGDGHEFYVASSSGIPKFMRPILLGLEFCQGFYKRIDDNFCVNLDHDNHPDEWFGGQWCYVSSQCTSAAPANGTGTLRVKLCAEGRDKLLRDKPLAELFAWAKSNDFETGLLLKMAYPLEKKATWPLIKDVFSGSKVNLEEFPALRQAHERLPMVMRPGKPLVLDSPDGHPPFGVVQDSTAYLLELPMTPKDMSHPNSITTVTCVAGCGQ